MPHSTLLIIRLQKRATGSFNTIVVLPSSVLLHFLSLSYLCVIAAAGQPALLSFVCELVIQALGYPHPTPLN